MNKKQTNKVNTATKSAAEAVDAKHSKIKTLNNYTYIQFISKILLLTDYFKSSLSNLRSKIILLQNHIINKNKYKHKIRFTSHLKIRQFNLSKKILNFRKMCFQLRLINYFFTSFNFRKISILF